MSIKIVSMSTLPLDLEATRKRLHGSDVLVHGTTYVVEVMAPPGTLHWYSLSSSHAVLFARLTAPYLENRWVIFKFALGTHQSVVPLTQGEMAAMKRRYALLQQFCAEFDHYNPYNRKILVNKPMIVSIGPWSVWMEDYVPQFRKFWGESSSLAERLVTSGSAALSLLQCFIYLRSDQNYTVIDLQGGVDERNYVLCDVEFTNSLSSFPDLLNIYLHSEDFVNNKTRLAGLPLLIETSLSAWNSQFSNLDSPASSSSTFKVTSTT